MSLRVGQEAPDFSATAVYDQEFKEITLSGLRGKWVVLFFYPLDFTFVCPTEITAFSDRYQDFSALNTEILGVSVDSKHCHLAWIQTPRNEGGIGDINYPLVSDLKREICQAYNVLNDDGEADRGLFLILLIAQKNIPYYLWGLPTLFSPQGSSLPDILHLGLPQRIDNPEESLVFHQHFCLQEPY